LTCITLNYKLAAQALLLLLLHLATLGLFAQCRWCHHEKGVAAAVRSNFAAVDHRVPLTAEHITTVCVCESELSFGGNINASA
jgi:hypothetical protein